MNTKSIKSRKARCVSRMSQSLFHYCEKISGKETSSEIKKICQVEQETPNDVGTGQCIPY